MIIVRVYFNVSDFNNIKLKKAKIRNQFAPHLTGDTILESDKNTKTSPTKEPRGQPFSQQVITRVQGPDKIVK